MHTHEHKSYAQSAVSPRPNPRFTWLDESTSLGSEHFREVSLLTSNRPCGASPRPRGVACSIRV